uniref:Ig-like domain-containing protein n=1 Tax=Poecilia latipinna TaxID=48699 RepID=A0A3B3V2Z8_9TELE
MKMMIVFGIILHVSRQASAVEMLEGQSVLLFCEFPTDDMDRPTVEWSRSDLSPSTVHQRQQEGDQLMDQNQLYRGRTSMKTDALETGDLSLNLTNLQTSDTGTYSCSVRSDRGKQRVRSEELLVKKLSSSWTKQLPVLLVLILTVVNVASALFYYFRHRLFSETKMELEKEKHYKIDVHCVRNPFFFFFFKLLPPFSLYDGYMQ